MRSIQHIAHTLYNHFWQLKGQCRILVHSMCNHGSTIATTATNPDDNHNRCNQPQTNETTINQQCFANGTWSSSLLLLLSVPSLFNSNCFSILFCHNIMIVHFPAVLANCHFATPTPLVCFGAFIFSILSFLCWV